MIKIYTDGGKDKICFIIGEQKPIVRQTTGETTNGNEYLAVVHAMQEAKNQGLTEVEVWADSELVVKQLTTRRDGKPVYRTKDVRLSQLRQLVYGLMEHVKATFNWLPREKNPAGWKLEEEKKKERRKHV